jgi:hypothetical protein
MKSWSLELWEFTVTVTFLITVRGQTADESFLKT